MVTTKIQHLCHKMNFNVRYASMKKITIIHMQIHKFKNLCMAVIVTYTYRYSFSCVFYKNITQWSKKKCMSHQTQLPNSALNIHTFVVFGNYTSISVLYTSFSFKLLFIVFSPESPWLFWSGGHQIKIISLKKKPEWFML